MIKSQKIRLRPLIKLNIQLLIENQEKLRKGELKLFLGIFGRREPATLKTFCRHPFVK